MKFKSLLIMIAAVIVLSSCSSSVQNIDILNFVDAFGDETSLNNISSPQMKPFENLKNYELDDIKFSGKVNLSGRIETFTNIKDMETCLTNEKLRNDYKNNYQLELPKYYYIPGYCLDRIEECAAALQYSGSSLFAISTVYYPNTKDGIKLLMSTGYVSANNNPTFFSPDLDFGADYNSVNINGTTIYWLTTNNIKMFPGLNTMYIWAQDGFFGYLVYAGKHKEENFKFCNLAKRVI